MAVCSGDLYPILFLPESISLQALCITGTTEHGTQVKNSNHASRQNCEKKVFYPMFRFRVPSERNDTMNKRDLNLRKKARSLASAECCNFHKGRCMETDCSCHLINERYETVRDGMIDCDWFWQAVLPLYPELQCELMMDLYQIKASCIKPCCQCGKPFVPTSNRQRYCNRCRTIGARMSGKERTKRWREKKSEETVTV